MYKISPLTPLFFNPSTDAGLKSRYIQEFCKTDHILLQIIGEGESEPPSVFLINHIDNSSYKLELLKYEINDEQTLFPLCRKFEKNISGESSHPAENYTPNQEEDTIEALLADLKSIMIKHLTGEYNENLCYAVIFAICSLEKDIKQHDRIRYKILMPMLTVSDTYI